MGFRDASRSRRLAALAAAQRLVNVGALSEARFGEKVKGGEVLCARSIKPFALKEAARGCGGYAELADYGIIGTGSRNPFHK
jgi:hypothetical protein